MVEFWYQVHHGLQRTEKKKKKTVVSRKRKLITTCSIHYYLDCDFSYGSIGICKTMNNLWKDLGIDNGWLQVVYEVFNLEEKFCLYHILAAVVIRLNQIWFQPAARVLLW